jgi:flagellin
VVFRAIPPEPAARAAAQEVGCKANTMPRAARAKGIERVSDYLCDHTGGTRRRRPAGTPAGTLHGGIEMASFSVVNNISSMTAQANLQVSNLGLQKALTRLSSGLRINQSGDDAAGLAVANGYRADVASITQGVRNANDGLSSLQIVDGALNNISTLLDRMASLASQAANTNFSGSRTVLDNEFQDLLTEIDEEASVAGLGGAELTFTVFVGSGADITGTIDQADATGLGLSGDITSAANAATALTAVKTAVTNLGVAQGAVGTLQNTLQYRISLVQTQIVNIKAAESRIRDANIAEESANMTRFNILNQSGVAALAQANQSSASLLSLLR